MKDIRFVLRALRAEPLFALPAIGVLALGIGASVATFSVVDGVYFHPLGYRDADRLVVVWEDRSAEGGTVRSPASPTTFRAWQEQQGAFAEIAALRNENRTLSALERPLVPLTHLVSENYFSMLGVEPYMGRVFQAGDAAARDAVLVSYALWQSALGGDSAVVGSVLELNGEPYTIAGVIGPDFYSHHIFPTQPDLWLATDFDDPPAFSEQRNLFVLGRLAPGVDAAGAQQAMQPIAQELARTRPRTHEGWEVRVEPLREYVVGGLRQTFLLVFAAVASVLLIACANVASLMLARAARREREIAVRVALGASTPRILRLLLTEGLLLALSGGALGVLIAMFLTPRVVALVPQGAGVPFLDEVGMDGGVLLFALVVSVASSLLFSVTPARQLLGARGDSTLRQGVRSRGERGGGGRRADVLVTIEIALAMAVVVAASLLAQSLWRLRSVDLGFDPEHLVTLRSSLRLPAGKPELSVPHFRELERRLAALPGVESVGSVSFLPPLNPRFVVDVESSAMGAGVQGQATAIPRSVTPGYFDTMGIAVLAGRGFDARDTADSQQVVVINEALRRRYFGSVEPVGRTLRLGATSNPMLGPSLERLIVGVVSTVVAQGVQPEPQPALYLPHAQAPLPNLNVVVRGRGDLSALGLEAERVAWEMPGDRNVYGLQTVAGALADTRWRGLFATSLVALFAAVALVLATAGIYAVVGHNASRRIPEIGLRLALGAQRRGILKLLVLAVLRPAAVGVLLGAAGALALGRLLSSLLFGVHASDPLTLVLVGAALLFAASAASAIPAWRAARLDPLSSLRAE